MFSKPKPVEPTNTTSATMPSPPAPDPKTGIKPSSLIENSSAPKPKAAPSVLSSDLTIKGNLKTTGDIQIEGVQRYPLSNHLNWLANGKPGGHKSPISILDSDALSEMYQNSLARIDATDTLVAIAKVP